MVTSAGFDGQPEVLADIMMRDAMASALATLHATTAIANWGHRW